VVSWPLRLRENLGLLIGSLARTNPVVVLGEAHLRLASESLSGLRFRPLTGPYLYHFWKEFVPASGRS
jgi:hypothetical protein